MRFEIVMKIKKPFSLSKDKKNGLWFRVVFYERQSMLVFLLLFRRSFFPFVMPGLIVSVAVVSETIIADGVVSPIRMASFPSVETLQPEWIGDQPDIAGSQIEILAANETDVFVAIPDVSFRNHYWLRCRSHIYHWWRNHNLRH